MFEIRINVIYPGIINRCNDSGFNGNNNYDSQKGQEQIAEGVSESCLMFDETCRKKS